MNQLYAEFRKNPALAWPYGVALSMLVGMNLGFSGSLWHVFTLTLGFGLGVLIFRKRSSDSHQRVRSRLSHDLRSPLAALKVLFPFAKEWPVDKREIFFGAVESLERAVRNIDPAVKLSPIAEQISSDGSSHFATQIDLNEGDEVIVVDDDPSMLGAWKQRLSEHSVTLTCFERALDFLKYMENRDRTNKKFFLDYDLGSGVPNGLALVDLLKIGKDSVLVTSQGADPKIQGRARALGVRILPKSNFASSPIVKKSSEA